MPSPSRRSTAAFGGDSPFVDDRLGPRLRMVGYRMNSAALSSRTVARHYARGVLGLVALVGAVVGAAGGASVALALLIVTVAAWRGCPTCWALGLVQTREREGCADGHCMVRS
jgi:hypothetical protein